MSVVSVFMESRSHKRRAFKFAESIVACSRVCVCELSHFRAQSVTKQPNFSYIWHFLLHLSGKTKGRSKKWRELLKFPHHTISAHLKNESKLSLAFPWSLLSLVFSLAVPLPTVNRICLNRFPVCRTYFLYIFNTQFSSLMTGPVYKSPLEGNCSDSFALAARDFSEPLTFSTKW